MKVYVNDKEVNLVPGMTVQHALIETGLLKSVESGKKVYDEYENEVGLSGELTENMRFYVR